MSGAKSLAAAERLGRSDASVIGARTLPWAAKQRLGDALALRRVLIDSRRRPAVSRLYPSALPSSESVPRPPGDRRRHGGLRDGHATLRRDRFSATETTRGRVVAAPNPRTGSASSPEPGNLDPGGGRVKEELQPQRRAGSTLADVCRRLADAAPAVALVNRHTVVLVSDRVGNHQYQPTCSTLLDQHRVR
jgi:hypothetical protein